MIGVLRLGWSAVYVHRAPDGVTLVDAGPDYEGSWESLCHQLANLGFSPRDARDVLITHAHIDHAGLAWRWQSLGAKIWIGAQDRAALAGGADGVTHMRATARRFFQSQGVPEGLSPGPFPTREGETKREKEDDEPEGKTPNWRGDNRQGGDKREGETPNWRDDEPEGRFPENEAGIESGKPAVPESDPLSPQSSVLSPGHVLNPGLRRGHYDHAAHWPDHLRWKPAAPDGVLADGAEVCGLRVIACPGHTPGSVALYDVAARLLYTGDHLLPGMTPPPGLNFDGEARLPSLPSWLASMRRLRRYDGARVLPGHGESFEDLGGAIERNLAHIEQQTRRLSRLLRRGPATPYELLHGSYPHLPSGLRWFKLAEIIGQLDVLLEHGTVQRVAGDEGCYVLTP